MGTETERKFLVTSEAWKKEVVKSAFIAQAYLSKDPDRAVRIRIMDTQAFITIKSKPPAGSIATPEFEYEIPLNDAKELLKLCLPGAITKTRHYIPAGDKKFEVDVFEGANAGLVVAEIELKNENDAFDKPAWLGAEVTHDKAYKNSNLSDNPYKGWKKNQPLKNNPPKFKS